MKTCRRCGRQVEDNRIFCPGCGFSVPDSNIKKEIKIPRKRPVLIAAAVFGAVLLITALILVLNLPEPAGDPASEFISYEKKLLSSILDFPAEPLAGDLTVRVDTAGEAPLLDQLTWNLRMKVQEEEALVNLDLLAEDRVVLTLNAAYENGQTAFQIPQSSDRVYRGDWSEISEKLSGQLGEALDKTEQARNLPSFIQASWEVMAQVGVREDTVTKSRDKNQTVYVYRPAAEDVEQMLLACAELLEENKALAEELRETAAQKGKQAEEAGLTWTLTTEKNQVKGLTGESRHWKLAWRPGTLTYAHENGGSFSWEVEADQRTSLGLPVGRYTHSRWTLEVTEEAEGWNHVLTLPEENRTISVFLSRESTAEAFSGKEADISQYEFPKIPILP